MRNVIDFIYRTPVKTSMLMILYLILALLMAARLHEFNRSTSDVVKIVKVHESTVRKRYAAFSA